MTHMVSCIGVCSQSIDEDSLGVVTLPLPCMSLIPSLHVLYLVCGCNMHSLHLYSNPMSTKTSQFGIRTQTNHIHCTYAPNFEEL